MYQPGFAVCIVLEIFGDQMEAFAKFLGRLAAPIVVLNIFGGIVSGTWLAILGEWELVGYGILALLIAGKGLGLVMAPGLIFAGPAVAMLGNGNKIGGYFFGLLSTIYSVGVLTGWCILVLIYFTSHAGPKSLIPVLIWSYGIATGPIVGIAQIERRSGNEYAMITAFFIAVAYTLTALAVVSVGVSLLHVLVIFVAVMSIGLIAQFFAAFLPEKSRANY